MKNQSIVRIIKAIALVVITLFSILSCAKKPLEDSAEDFVGEYKASVIDNVRWGSDSGTLTGTGTFYISKVSSSRVKVSGYINTYGEVNGKMIYFESITNTDSEGTITTVFQQGILNGNVMTFSSTSTGQLSYMERCIHTVQPVHGPLFDNSNNRINYQKSFYFLRLLMYSSILASASSCFFTCFLCRPF